MKKSEFENAFSEVFKWERETESDDGKEKEESYLVYFQKKKPIIPPPQFIINLAPKNKKYRKRKANTLTLSNSEKRMKLAELYKFWELK